MSEEKRAQMEWEQQYEAEEYLAQLLETENEITETINGFKAEALKFYEENDDVNGDQVAANILYLDEVRKMVLFTRIKFKAIVKITKITNAVNGVRPMLRKTADMLNSIPGADQTNSEFLNFKKALMRGKFNTESLFKMMSASTPVNKNNKKAVEDFKNSLLMSKRGATGTVVEDPQINSAQQNADATTGNKDFFDAINNT